MQVNKEHYYSGYDNDERFLGYFDTISTVSKLITKKETIIEIGIGNGTVSTYLKKNGFSIKTIDFDKNLGADFHCDITKKIPKEIKKTDLVIATELLEHIRKQNVKNAIKNICYLSKKYCYISLPEYGNFLEFNFKIFFRPTFKRISYGTCIKLPNFNNKFSFFAEGFNQHYWELGTKKMKKSEIILYFKKNNFSLVYEKRIKNTPGVITMLFKKNENTNN